MEEVKVIGQLPGKYESINRVYNKNGLSPTLSTMTGGDRQPKIIDKNIICRLTGRNPDNPKSRQSGLPTEQMLEPNAQGICGALTTVQKDNLCLEIKQATKEGSIKCKVGGCYDASYPDSKTRRGRVQEGGDITPTITAQGGENINFVETVYRIRKLTPRETWRLMGYTDKDFEKAAEVNSNTQLYRESGNAIVKQVMMAIFLQMGIKGLKKWEERSEEEKAELIRGSIYDKADFQ